MIDEIITVITHAIFFGTCVFVPLLFALHLFKLKLPMLDNSTIILTVNFTLLLGSSIFIAQSIIDFPIRYYSGGEYEQYTFTNRMVGPYWFNFLMLAFNYALLPQLFWIKRVRRSIISPMIVIVVRFIFVLAMLKVYVISPILYLKIEFPLIYSLTQITIYLAIISAIYFILSRRNELLLTRKSNPKQRDE